MTDQEILLDAEGDDASVELSEGLRSCHAMVMNYRAMLTDALSEPAAYAESTTEAANDAEADDASFASSS